MSIYVTGDTHGVIDISKLSYSNHPKLKNITKDDYVIVCGDFGLPWQFNSDGTPIQSEKHWIKWLNSRSFNILFCDGNHENHDYLNSLPVSPWNNGNVHPVSKNIIHLMRGNLFIINGLKIWVMGGAESTDKHNRREGLDWFASEIPSHTEMDYGVKVLESVNWDVDIVISHTAPKFAISKISSYIIDDPTSNYLEFIRENLNYKHWYCGHMHTDLTIEDCKLTFCYDEIHAII